MTFTAVVCSHDFQRGLHHTLGLLRYQTRPPTETIVLCSSTDSIDRFREDFPEARFVEVSDRSDWGHAKRDQGLRLATSEWVGFFNDDDSYSRRYIEKMLDETPNADVVYCNWNEDPGARFEMGSSNSGNFIVRTDLAQTVGWQGRRYEADGDFINAVRDTGCRVVKVDDLLYTHNFWEDR